jgi:hypothetical protein
LDREVGPRIGFSSVLFSSFPENPATDLNCCIS